jgi:hypothetical protein
LMARTEADVRRPAPRSAMLNLHEIISLRLTRPPLSPASAAASQRGCHHVGVRLPKSLFAEPLAFQG